MTHIELGPALSELAPLGIRATLSLDFRGISIVSASTLTKLIVLRRNLRALGGRLILRNVPPSAYEVLHATRLDTIFEFRRTPSLMR
jgi:anti-anti-sigma regulatory factor